MRGAPSGFACFIVRIRARTSAVARPSWLSPALPALPTPVAPETLTMPADDGLGSNDVNAERQSTSSETTRPEQAIGWAKARSLAFACRLPVAGEAPDSRMRLRRLGRAKLKSNERRRRNHCYQNARTAHLVVKAAWAQTPESKRLRSFGEPFRLDSRSLRFLSRSRMSVANADIRL
jgi:hypothetical protein